MLNETIETSGHTTKDGILNLSIKVGAADADVAVIVQVRAVTPEDGVDTNGWPSDFWSALPDRCPICSVRLKATLSVGLILNDLASLRVIACFCSTVLIGNQRNRTAVRAQRVSGASLLILW